MSESFDHLILRNAGQEDQFTVETVIVAAGTQASGIGQVLGKIAVSGKYTTVNPFTGDGSQVPVAVLVEGFSSRLVADGEFKAITAGPVALRRDALLFTGGMNLGQIAETKRALVVAGMLPSHGTAIDFLPGNPY
jgi:hypothetical protein